MKFFKSRQSVIVLTILLVLLIIIGLIVWQRDRFVQLRSLIASVNLAPRSQVMIDTADGDSSESSKLTIKFKITDSDRTKAGLLSTRLGISNDWMEGLTLSLNRASIDRLKPILPLDADLQFNDNEILISKAGFGALDSSAPNQTFEYASESGKLTAVGKNISNFELEIEAPDVVLRTATESGKLYLSPQMSGLEQLLSQVSRLQLQVSGESVLGSIKLK